MKAPREADTLAACLHLLALRGIFAWRTSNHAVRRTDKTGRQFYAFHGERGLPDICGVLRPSGKLLCVEVKAPGKRPSAEQAAFLAAVAAAGGLALVIDDVAQLDRALAEVLP